MNQKNLEYLTDQVKYTGFGDDLSNDLKNAVAQGAETFKLNHVTAYGGDTVEATLNFSKSSTSDMYFFNSYEVALQKENTAEKLEQRFYINKGSNITLKEAYNLMEGRAVNKDLTNQNDQKYNVWLQLDFKHSDDHGNFRLKKFTENYGYDLDAAVAKHPIKQLERDDLRDNLMDSLKKGNIATVTFQVEGKEQTHYIEAVPQFKTVNVYDENMQKLGSREIKSEKQAQGETQSEKKANKQSAKATDEESGTETQAEGRKKKKQGQSM